MNQIHKIVILKKYQKHEPISFSYYIKCFDDNVFKPVLRSYTGEDAMQKFVESLEKDVREIAKIPPKKMIFGEKEKERFKRKLYVGYVKKNSMIQLMKMVIKRMEKL